MTTRKAKRPDEQKNNTPHHSIRNSNGNTVYLCTYVVLSQPDYIGLLNSASCRVFQVGFKNHLRFPFLWPDAHQPRHSGIPKHPSKIAFWETELFLYSCDPKAPHLSTLTCTDTLSYRNRACGSKRRYMADEDNNDKWLIFTLPSRLITP